MSVIHGTDSRQLSSFILFIVYFWINKPLKICFQHTEVRLLVPWNNLQTIEGLEGWHGTINESSTVRKLWENQTQTLSFYLLSLQLLVLSNDTELWHQFKRCFYFHTWRITSGFHNLEPIFPCSYVQDRTGDKKFWNWSSIHCWRSTQCACPIQFKRSSVFRIQFIFVTDRFGLH